MAVDDIPLSIAEFGGREKLDALVLALNKAFDDLKG